MIYCIQQNVGENCPINQNLEKIYNLTNKVECLCIANSVKEGINDEFEYDN